jgi:hypothetical protein
LESSLQSVALLGWPVGYRERRKAEVKIEKGQKVALVPRR